MTVLREREREREREEREREEVHGRLTVQISLYRKTPTKIYFNSFQSLSIFPTQVDFPKKELQFQFMRCLKLN